MATSFIENINLLTKKLPIIENANYIFDKELIPVLEEVAALDLLEVNNDLLRGEYLGNRKIDIDLALNVNGITDELIRLHPTDAEALWAANSTSIPYEKAIITFTDGEVIELPFLSDGNPVNVTTTSGLLIQLNRTDVVTAVAQEDLIYSFDVLNNMTYTVEINNVDYSYTTSNQATRGEIVTGLTNQINNGNSPFTAYNEIDYVRIKSDVPGNPFIANVDDNMLIRTDVANVIAGNYETAFLKKLKGTSFSSFTTNTVNDIIRFYDIIGSNSNIERIQLITVPGLATNYNNSAPIYYWAKTTSSLKTLAMRAGDIIKLGNEIDNLILLSSSINEILEIQARIPELVDTYTNGNPNGDLTIYNKLAEIDAIAQALNKLAIIYDDIKNGGTNYINTLATDLQDVDSAVRTVSADLQSIDSKIETLYTNIAKITSVYDNIVNNNVSKIVGIIDDNSVSKIVANIDNANVSKIAAKINDLSVDRIVTQIDNTNIPTIAAKIQDGTIDTLADNIVNLTDIHDNLPEILLADNSAAAAAASAANANAYAITAKTYAESMRTLTAQALTLTAGSPANVTYDGANNKLVLGIPQGPKGDRGEAFNVSATGPLSARSAYDSQPAGYSFLATDTGELYIKNSDVSGDWSPAIPFGRGETGATGAGIASITFTNTTDPSGLPYKLNAIDTYMILFTNGASTTYQVANGYGQTYRIVTADYEASEGDYLLCDSRSAKQKDLITNIVVTQGGTYEVTVDGQSAVYTADATNNQTTNLQNIVVLDNSTYTVAVNGVEATYVSDPLVKQQSTLTVNTVLDSTTYSVDIDGIVSTYTSDAAVKQKNTVNNITVKNGFLYQLDINGTTIGYVSDSATAQKDRVTNIVAADSTLYSLVIEGTEVSYVSGVGATIDQIRDGLIAAINSNANVNGIVTAVDNGFDIDVSADVVGVVFTATVSAGTMQIDTVSPAGYATLAEITNGLVNAINTSAAVNGEVTAVITAVGEFTVTSDVAGLPFTLTVATGTMTNTVITPNNNTTLAEILVGLKNAINLSAAPVLASVVSNTIVIEANVGGVPFTVTPDAFSTVTVDVAANKATLAEITAGLASAINALGQDETAVDKSTYVAISANTHEGTFTVSVVSGTMDVVTVAANEATLAEIIIGLKAAIDALGNTKIVTSTVGSDIVIEAVTSGVGYTIALVQGTITLANARANQAGVANITLPNAPANGTTVTIMDISGSFGTLPVTVLRNGSLIMGLDEDMLIDVAQAKVEMIYVNNDWRFE